MTTTITADDPRLAWLVAAWRVDFSEQRGALWLLDLLEERITGAEVQAYLAGLRRTIEAQAGGGYSALATFLIEELRLDPEVVLAAHFPEVVKELPRIRAFEADLAVAAEWRNKLIAFWRHGDEQGRRADG